MSVAFIGPNEVHWIIPNPIFHGTLTTCDILGVSSSQYQREVKMSKGHVHCNQTVSSDKIVEQDYFQGFINKEHVLVGDFTPFEKY